MEAYLVIGVLMFMASLLFCKSLLECVQTLMHVLAECSGCAGNCECVSMNYGEKRSAREVLMILLVLWSVGKPCLLILGPLLGEFVLARPPQWTVVFVQVVLNTSRFAHKQGPDATQNRSLHRAGPASGNDVQVQMREVEGLVLVMPFALLSASSTWTWVGLKNDGFFAGDQVWDQELFTSRGMQLYEILYGFEIYSLLFSLLSIAGDPVSVEDVSLTTLSVTLSLLYFFAYSRSRSQAFAENMFGMMLLASMSCVLGIFLIAHMRVCGIQQSAAAVAVTLVLCLSLTHVSNKDEMHAGSVILLRTLFSCVASLYFVVLSAANSNSVCV